MKRIAGSFVLFFIMVFALPVHAGAVKMLVPVGQVVGLQLGDDKVIVAAFDELLGETARAAGLQVGDEILEIDDRTIDCAGDVRRALECSDGKVELEILRGGKEKEIEMTPVSTEDGPRLGVYLRQGITGIGTVTWYDPESGCFGTLGHGVNGSDGQLLEMRQGSVYRAAVRSIRKGEVGQPGQLVGALEGAAPIGMLTKNSDRGVFGTVVEGWDGTALPIASDDEIRTGAATIRCSLTGREVREYSVEILKIYPASKESGRNLLVKVTDPQLLEATGGIVQGMSGSPIIQDGKLIGAVTHVLVNDPTTGYGIFIENMLDAAA